MIDKINEDIKKYLEQYDNMLWYIEVNRCSYGDNNQRYYTNIKKVYYGTESVVRRLMSLRYIEYKIEKFDIDEHKILNIEDAEKEFKEIFIPKMSGDIVEYQGKMYTVSGFSGETICLKNGCDFIDIKKEEIKNMKLIHSEYWGEYKK